VIPGRDAENDAFLRAGRNKWYLSS